MQVNEILCIGSNKFGQAGAGKKYHNQTFNNFTKIVFPVFIKQVVCGSHHSGLLTLEGLVYMMGSNTNGTLGVSTSTINYSYSPILVETLNEITKIASGHHHMCAIGQGKLYSWGKGVDGQLGTGKQINCPMPTLVESFGGDVEEVSCGLNHTLVKTTNKKCYAFGNGIYGQLGIGSNKNSLFPVQVKIQQVNDIAAGENFSLFIKNGVVFGTGDNSNGQISHEIKKKYALEPTQLKINRATAIRASKFSAAVVDDKHLYIWGLKTHPEPFAIKEVEGYIMDFQTGGNLIYCLSSQGELYEWRNTQSLEKVWKATQLKDKTILGFSVGESHSIVLGDIVGQINVPEGPLKFLQNVQDPQTSQDQSILSRTSTAKLTTQHNASLQSLAPSISSEHYSRTPSSIMREPSNFIKAQSKLSIPTPTEIKKTQSKNNIQVTEFMRDKSVNGLNQIGTSRNEVEISECMKKIDEIMSMLARNNKLEEIQHNVGEISRKNTRSRLQKTASRQFKQNHFGERGEKTNRQFIMQLREKQLKISELQQKLSRKDIQIESQRQLINLLRKINTQNQ